MPNNKQPAENKARAGQIAAGKNNPLAKDAKVQPQQNGEVQPSRAARTKAARKNSQ